MRLMRERDLQAKLQAQEKTHRELATQLHQSEQRYKQLEHPLLTLTQEQIAHTREIELLTFQVAEYEAKITEQGLRMRQEEERGRAQGQERENLIGVLREEKEKLGVAVRNQ